MGDRPQRNRLLRSAVAGHEGAGCADRTIEALDGVPDKDVRATLRECARRARPPQAPRPECHPGRRRSGDRRRPHGRPRLQPVLGCTRAEVGRVT
jgi:hypothetical protein